MTRIRVFVISQIRMTPDAWLQTAALKKEIEKQNHYDTGYILNKLLADGAFHFCAFANDVRDEFFPLK